MNTKTEKILNTIKIVGELVEVNLETKTSPRSGKDYIAGNIIVKSIINGTSQLTKLEIYTPKFKQDGEPNKLYETYSNLGALLNKRVNVSGELGESRFLNDTQELISNTVNKTRYISPADTGEKDTSDFAFQGYVVKPLYERNSRDGNLLSYEIVLAQPNWNKTKPVLIKFTVDKENKTAVNAIQRLYEKGMTVIVRGKVSVVNETIEIAQDTAFGEATRVFNNTYKNYFIQTGSPPFNAFTPQEIVQLTRAYDDESLALQAKGKDSVKTEEKTTVAKTSRLGLL